MKPLKLPNEDNNNDSKKFFDNFIRRLENVESKKHVEEEETDSEKEWKCAELRHERIMKLAQIMGYEEALSHWRDGITDYELKWELEKALRVPPELRYQNKKKDWQNHESSWWIRHNTTTPPLTGYDGQGCSGEHGCVPECRYYAEIGRIEDDEVIKHHEERKKREREEREEENRKLGFSENDSDEIKKQKWQEIRELKRRIHDQQTEYLRLNQHTWQSSEELKAIETAAWDESYNSKKKEQEQQPNLT